MSEFVLVALPQSSDRDEDLGARSHWLHYDRLLKKVVDRGVVQDAIDQLRELGRRCPVWILAPGELVPAYVVSMPTGGSVAKNALPYSLEEQLCGELDEQFFATEKLKANKPTFVSVVEREQMAAWHQWLKSLEIKIKGMASEALCVPVGTVIDDGERAIVRAEQVAATLDRANLQDWLTLADLSVAPMVSDDRLKTLAEQFSEPPHSMLQEPFVVKDPVSAAVKLVRIPAIAASVTFAAWLLFLGLDTAYTHHQIAATDDAIKSVFKETFPETRRVRSPIKQMKSKLALQGGGGDGGGNFLVWLQKVSDSAASNKAVSIEQVQYQSSPETLRIVVKADSFTAGDALTEKLKALGLSVQRGAFTQQGKKVSGQLTISGGES